MARTRYISNSRTGEAGSEIRGDVIYAPIAGRIGIGGVGQAKKYSKFYTKIYIRNKISKW